MEGSLVSEYRYRMKFKDYYTTECAIALPRKLGSSFTTGNRLTQSRNQVDYKARHPQSAQVRTAPALHFVTQTFIQDKQRAHFPVVGGRRHAYAQTPVRPDGPVPFG